MRHLIRITLLIGIGFTDTTLVSPESVSGCTVQPNGVSVPCRELQPHRPTKCEHLYNVGRSNEWQACMGVAKL